METKEMTLENRLKKLEVRDTANYILYTDAGCVSDQQAEDPLYDEVGAILLIIGYRDIRTYGSLHVMKRRGENGTEVLHYKPIEENDSRSEYIGDMKTKIALLPKDNNRKHSLGEIVRAFLQNGKTIIVDARDSGEGHLLRKYYVKDGEINFDKIEIGYKPPYEQTF